MPTSSPPEDSDRAPRVWLVSACLFGQRCRYDGNAAKAEARRALPVITEQDSIVPVCPEVLGGLSTPRPAANLRGGDGANVLLGTATVVTGAGDDVTDAFRRGAQRTLEVARDMGATHACLKARSPSCGSRQIYFDHGGEAPKLAAGDGVTAAVLKQGGIQVFSDEEVRQETNEDPKIR